MAEGRGFSISDIFSGGRQGNQSSGTPAPATVPGSNGIPSAPVNPGADVGANLEANKGILDPNLGPDGKPKTPDNPLDGFKDFFTITEDDRKKQPPDQFAEPLLNFDPKKFGDTAGKMNFAGNIDPALMQKAMSGDQQAFAAVLNRVAQSSFTASAQVLTGILEQAFKKNNGRWDGSLDSRFRNLQLTNTRSTNPVLQHPAAAPLLEGMKATIAAKDPTMRPEEVARKAEEYFGAFTDMMIASRAPKETPATSASDDWTKFLGV